MVRHSIIVKGPLVDKHLLYSWRTIESYKDWCKEYVGANNWNYYGEHKIVPCEFRFKKSEDLLAFKIRFGL
jgi:hypothetical protein